MIRLSIAVLVFVAQYSLISAGFSDYLPNLEPFSYDITPPNPIKEVLLQDFKCKQGSELRRLHHSSSYEDTTSCNDWKLTKNNAMFNITLGTEQIELRMKGLTTYTVHLNGNLALIQRGSIDEGECAGGFFEKFVFNAVDQSGCSGNGIAKQIPLYSLAQITGGKCEAVCPGKVNVWFDPPVRNLL